MPNRDAEVSAWPGMVMTMVVIGETPDDRTAQRTGVVLEMVQHDGIRGSRRAARRCLVRNRASERQQALARG